MTSIGIVMFGKAVILAVWAIGSDRYKDFKRKHYANGQPMRLNRKGVYVPDNRFALFEKWAKRTLIGLACVFALYTIWAWWVILSLWPVE